MMTFCWFPPDRDWMGVLSLGVLMLSFWMFWRTSSEMRLSSSIMWYFRYWERDATATLSLTDSTPKMPVARRSSVIMAIPWLIASLGRAMRICFPRYSTLPSVMARKPKIPSISSVRWAPTRPLTPRISPLRSSKLTCRKDFGLMEV
ncbi:hypothetical protein SDC9_155648 [bioreactor metagenome]|uniref:Uncharacterized protein n=1 Tax=bioreactor metagenome TaxID=1076179 RepID=A0A645F400_9ZZZZ